MGGRSRRGKDRGFLRAKEKDSEVEEPYLY